MTISLPREEIRPAWRAAVQAYRLEYRATREDHFARDAAFEAFRKVLPDMPEEQAKMEANHAIAYAAANYTKWFLERLIRVHARGASPIARSSSKSQHTRYAP